MAVRSGATEIGAMKVGRVAAWGGDEEEWPAVRTLQDFAVAVIFRRGFGGNKCSENWLEIGEAQRSPLITLEIIPDRKNRPKL